MSSGGMFLTAAVAGVATALTAGSQIAAAGAQAQSLKADAKGMELQAQAAREQAQDRIDQANQELRSTLAAQKAIFASRGVDVSSPTAVNLARADTRNAARDIASIRLGSSRQQQQYLQSAAARREEASTVRTLGLLGGGATVGRSLFGFLRTGV